MHNYDQIAKQIRSTLFSPVVVLLVLLFPAVGSDVNALCWDRIRLSSRTTSAPKCATAFN